LYKRIDTFQVGVAPFEAKPVIVEQHPTHLEIFALGAGLVRRDGQIIPKAAFRSSKARALIFYLIEKGGEARGADIRSDFWPEFAVGQATSNFQATLWRTRNALGSRDLLINEGDQYTLGKHVTFWYDASEFRTCIKRADDASASAFERAEWWRQAIRIYQGNYLEDIFMDWAQSQRVELESLYVKTLVNLAGWCVKQRHYADARILFEQALEKDAYRDDIHLAFMQCLVYSGAPNAAISHFLDYQKFLKKENLSPSQVLTDYYRHLLR
jgi:two-component SAPR family response regulator